MKLTIAKILLFCLFGAVLFYLFYLQYNIKGKLEVMNTELLHIKDTIEKKAVMEQKVHVLTKGKTEGFLENDNFKEFQKIVAEYVNKNIANLVPEKPTMGGKWNVSHIEFMSPDVIKVIYEDGHDQGVIFFRIESAYNSKIEIKPFY